MGWASRLNRLLLGQFSSRTLTAKPAVATARVMATTTGLFYLAGGCLVFVKMPGLARDHGHTGIIAAIATGAAVVGAILFASRSTGPSWPRCPTAAGPSCRH